MKHFYFIGLCGTAMAGVAVALKEMGYSISGSDSGVYPPMSTYLEEHGIHCHVGFDSEYLNPAPDIVVIGNAISRGNPEVEFVLDSGIPYMSLPELVRITLLSNTVNIVVTGTHGKTSTTSLIAWVLQNADVNTGYMIGGVAKNFSESCKPAEYHGAFVLEGDEYDTAFFDKRSKFVHYVPNIAVINNIEFDHADIFRDLADVLRSFRQLVNIVPGSGLLLANGDDPNALLVAEQGFTAVETFGLGTECNWRATDINTNDDGVYFTVLQNDEVFGKFRFPFPGEFQVRNCLAAIAVTTNFGLNREQIQSGFLSFLGVKRRMEIIYEDNTITIIDDFAHHPTAIRETLNALKSKYPERRLWAIFEPRSNTSTRKVLQNDLIEALAIADGVVLGSVNRPERYAAKERLDPQAVVEKISAQNKRAEYIPNTDEIVVYLQWRKQPGDVFVVMSNGSFNGLHGKLVEALR